jgi:pseudouridine synthase
MRLNKLLSMLGVASRRTADELIVQGRVEINSRVVATPGVQADPERDDIRVDGRRLKRPPARRYLLLNKPAGVVSTRSDPQRRTTVIELLEQGGIRGYFYPVGRLDYESEGLILLTNDGAFAERVTHPRYELARTYEVTVAGVPDERDLRRLRDGVPLDGRRTLPASVRRLGVVARRQGPLARLEITLREGRNRQVRRMCDAIGHPAERLRRTRIGPVADPGLKPGRFRDLTPAEVSKLMGPHGRDRAKSSTHGSSSSLNRSQNRASRQ